MVFILLFCIIWAGLQTEAYGGELANSKGRIFKPQHYSAELENLRNDLYELNGINRTQLLKNKNVPGLKTFSTTDNEKRNPLDAPLENLNSNKCKMRGLVPVYNTSETVYECLTYWSEIAENSFSNVCGGAVKKDLLMCIFLREHHGRMEENTCAKNGCGIAQMTSIGAQGVKDALRYQEVLGAYQKFFINIGREDLAEQNISTLDRSDGLNMQRAVGMASALICQKVFEGARDTATLAERYNGNSKNGIRVAYRNFVSACVTDFEDGAISAFTRSGGEIKLASARLTREI